MAQFVHLGHRNGPAEVQEKHARGQPHQSTNKDPARETKLMSNSEPKWDWTFFKACSASQLYPTPSAASPEVSPVQQIKCLHFVSLDKRKLNTWVTFVQHTVHPSNKTDLLKIKVAPFKVLLFILKMNCFYNCLS